MQKTPKVIAPIASADAVLSPSLPQQTEDFAATQGDAFDQADQHPHVRQHGRGGQTRFVQHRPFQAQDVRHRQGIVAGLGRCCPRQGGIGRREVAGRGGLPLAAVIEMLLLRLAGSRSIVRRAPLAGALPAMVLSATERTTQVPPPRVPGMREKPYPAVPTVRYATQKLGMGPQRSVQRRLIVPNKRPGAILLMPIRAKRERLLDGDGKKARLSAIIPIVLCTTSFLPHRGQRFER